MSIIVQMKQILKNNKTRLVYLFITLFSILFTLLQFPADMFENAYDSEIFTQYHVAYQYFERYTFDVADRLKCMPLFHLFMHPLWIFTSWSFPEKTSLLRFAIYFLTLIFFKLMAQEFYKEKQQSFKLMAMALFFYIFDYNVNNLLLSDQMRNALGNMFMMAALWAFFKKSYTMACWVAILAIFSHKFFLVFVPFFIVFYFLTYTTKSFIPKINRVTYFLVAPSIGLLSVLFIKKFSYLMNLFGFSADKFAHPILKGLVGSFFSKPGVLMAVFLYGAFALFGWRNFNDLKQSYKTFLFFSIVLIGLAIARIGVFGLDFVEPNRVYIAYSPFLCLIWPLFLLEEKKWVRSLTLIGYFLINFAFSNFRRDNTQPVKTVLEQLSTFSLPNIYYYTLTYFIPLLFIAGLLFFILKRSPTTQVATLCKRFSPFLLCLALFPFSDKATWYGLATMAFLCGDLTRDESSFFTEFLICLSAISSIMLCYHLATNQEFLYFKFWRVFINDRYRRWREAYPILISSLFAFKFAVYLFREKKTLCAE